MLLLFSALAPPCDPRHPVLLNSPSMPSLKRGKRGNRGWRTFLCGGKRQQQRSKPSSPTQIQACNCNGVASCLPNVTTVIKPIVVFCCFTVLFFGKTLVTIIALEYVSLVFGYLIDPVHKLVETLSCNLSKCIPDR